MFADRSHLALALLAAAAPLLYGGCALLAESKPDRHTAALPPVPAARDAIELEIIFVERAIDDPLIGPALWRELAEIGGVSADERAVLRQNGFRVGYASSQPPQSLQTVLGLATTQFAEEDSLLSGRRLVMRSGAETEVLMNAAAYPACDVSIHAGERREQAYRNALCKFRVKGTKLQDGWARIEFVPEIHYDEERARPQPATGGWELQYGRKVDPLTALRFSVDVSLGEFAVITAEGRDPTTLGQYFFRSDDPDAKTQRLLIVRLADLSKSAPVYAD